jgi:hypothetical protein
MSPAYERSAAPRPTGIWCQPSTRPWFRRCDRRAPSSPARPPPANPGTSSPPIVRCQASPAIPGTEIAPAADRAEVLRLRSPRDAGRLPSEPTVSDRFACPPRSAASSASSRRSGWFQEHRDFHRHPGPRWRTPGQSRGRLLMQRCCWKSSQRMICAMPPACRCRRGVSMRRRDRSTASGSGPAPTSATPRWRPMCAGHFSRRSRPWVRSAPASFRIASSSRRTCWSGS